MLPDIASSMSESVGCGLLASSAEADMIWPDWQYPHCTTSRSSQAFWILAPAAVAPIASIVVISEVPMLSTGVTQERVATPSTCTVQAPHSAMPQPNFVPVMPSTSRNTQSSGVSPSTSIVRLRPLTLIVVAMAPSGLFAGLGILPAKSAVVTTPSCPDGESRLAKVCLKCHKNGVSGHYGRVLYAACRCHRLARLSGDEPCRALRVRIRESGDG